MGNSNKKNEQWISGMSRTAAKMPAASENKEMDAGANTQPAIQEKDTNRTQQLTEIWVRQQQFAALFAEAAVHKGKELTEKINQLVEEVRGLIDKRFVMMKNQDVWFDREAAALWPQLDKQEVPYLDHCGQIRCADMVKIKYSEDKRFLAIEIGGLDFVLPEEAEALTTFGQGTSCPYMGDDGCFRGIHDVGDLYGLHTIPYRDSVLHPYNGHTYYYHGYIAIIPIHRFKEKNAAAMPVPETLLQWLRCGLVPEGLSRSGEAWYRKLMEGYRQMEAYLDFSGSDRVGFAEEAFTQDVLAGRYTATVFDYCFDLRTSVADIMQGKKQYTDSPEMFKTQLLECDYRRANLAPYPEKRVTDINLGHWELFDAADVPGMVPVTLPLGIFWAARPPQMDIVGNGTCAIDFGTKSTVVVCRNNDARLLRIGEGDYNKEPAMKDYENPTVVNFRDIEGFREAYRQRKGRPYTEWEQITVSHDAQAALFRQDVDSSVYYAVFSELKQWANAKDRRLLLKDSQQGHVEELKLYLELQEEAFDPIEIYAYYLGLYINNMYNGIYLDYILSFPVNYAKDVRSRLLQSFERGLRKSLPDTLLRDAEAMERFRVYAGASEPAAYALSALKSYGLEPQAEGAMTAYGVFDFGGGTTDFDFGIEKIPPDRRKYKFEIEQFGRGGDVYLGGENILDLLAYEVFKKNISQMREKHITIVLPPDCRKIAGAETLILEPKEASQNAYMNRKVLAEELRPLWEHSGDYEQKFSQQLQVMMFASNQPEKQSKANVTLDIDKDFLEGVIKERIARGVVNFFTAWADAFRGREEQPHPMHILLAGNSCKAPAVRELFEEHIKKTQEEIAAKTNKSADGLFVLHMPLGMEKDAEGNEPSSEAMLEFDRCLTGKTGVAFGLLRSRRGGKDVRIINRNVSAADETIFPYFLGDIDAEDHFHVRIGREVDYGSWAPFCYADEEDFEIYYTSQPVAVENQMAPTEVRTVNCRIRSEDTRADDAVKIYIRKTAPDCIEFAVGTEAEFATPEGSREKHIYRQVLR